MDERLQAIEFVAGTHPKFNRKKLWIFLIKQISSKIKKSNSIKRYGNATTFSLNYAIDVPLLILMVFGQIL